MNKRIVSLALVLILNFALLPVGLFSVAAAPDPLVTGKGGATGTSSLWIYYDAYVTPAADVDTFARALAFGKTSPLTLSNMWDNWLADVTTTDATGGVHVAEPRIVLSHPTQNSTFIKLNLSMTLLRINDYTLKIPEGALVDADGQALPALSKTVSVDVSLPKLTQTAISRDNRTLTLTFSENIYARGGGDITGSLTRFGLAQADTTAETGRVYKSMEFAARSNDLWVGVVSMAIDRAQLVITLSEPLTKPYNYLRIEENTLFDLVGNALPADKSIKGPDGAAGKYAVAGPFSAGADSYPPEVSAADEAYATPDNKQIVITFNEPIFNNLADLPTLRDNIRIAFFEYIPGTLDPVAASHSQIASGDFGGANALPPNKLIHTDSVKISGSQLVITFTTPLSADRFAAVRIPSGALKDKAGNVHDPSLEALPDMSGYTYRPYFYSALADTMSDRAAPVYKDAMVGEDLKTITLLFSEPVRINVPRVTDADWLKTAALLSLLELRRDGEAAYRPLNETNRWNEEICLSMTVSGSKIVIVLRDELEGKQNFIRLSHATALCDFAHDGSPWRTDNTLDKEFTTKALDATADVSPPVLVSDKPCWAVSPDGRKVTLSFNEPLVNNLKTAAELRNALSVTYYVSDGVRATRDLSTFDPSSAAALSGSTLTVTFSKKLNALLAVSPSYQFVDLTLRAQNGAIEGAVRDKAGNVQKSDQTAGNIDARGDTTPPKVKQVLASPDRLTVTVWFDEPVQTGRNTASLLANLMVLRGFTASNYPQLADFQAKEAFFTGARLTADRLTLTLRVPLDGDRNFILIRGSTVSDTAGNAIAGDLALGPIDAFPDITPPALQAPAANAQFWLSADRRTLKLFFNEIVAPVDMDLPALRSNIGRSTTAVTGPYADLSDEDKVTVDGFTVTLQLAAPLTGTKNWFRIRGGALKDEYSNVQYDEGKLTTVCIDASPDELPPVYKTAAVSRDNRVITLTFSEPVTAAVSDMNTLKSRILFTDSKTYYALEKYYPGYTVAFSDRTMVITLPDSRPLTGKTNKLKILRDTVQDRATPSANPLKTDVVTAALAAWADETPPAFNPLTGTKLSAGKKTLTLSFSEIIHNNKASMTALKASLLIARDGSKFTELSYNDTVSVSGSQLIITYAAALTGEKTRVRLRAASLRDTAGNVQNREITTNAISTSDLTPPSFDALTGVLIQDGNKKSVTLSFSEPVISGFANNNELKAAVRVRRGGADFAPLGAKDTVTASGGKVTVSFAEPLRGNDNYIRIAADALSDKCFNAIARDINTGRIYATAPGYTPVTGYEINSAKKIVTLTFDRDIFPNTAKPGGLTAAVKIARNGGSFAALGARDTADVIDGKLYLTFDSALGARDKISLPAKSVKDYVGNTQTSEIITGPATFLPAVPDLKNGVKISPDGKLVTIAFNKAVRAAAGLAGQITLRRNGGAAAPLSAGDTAEIADGKVCVTLAVPLMGENNHVIIAGGALVDDTGITLGDTVDAGPIDAGTYKGPAEVTLGGRAVNGAQLTVSRDAAGRKMAAVRLDAAATKSAVAAAAPGGTLQAAAPGSVDGTALQGVTLVVTGDVLDAMQKKDITLMVSRGGVSCLIPAGGIDLKAAAVQMGQYYTAQNAVTYALSLFDTDAKLAEKLAQNAAKQTFSVLVPPVDFELSVQSKVRTLPLERYAARVERRFALAPGQEKQPNITGVTLDKDGNPVHIPTRVEQTPGGATARAWSLTNSTYAVVSAARTFPDVKKHWSKPYVEPMAGRFMLFGDSKGQFNPDQNMTRAEFAAVLLRSLGLMKTGVGVDRFSDVPRSAWFYDVVSIASEYKLMEAGAGGLFRPDQKITREEAVIAVYNALSLLDSAGGMSAAQANALLSRYADNAQVTGAARAPFAVCVSRGILEGSGGKLNPKNNIRRGEVCALMDRFMRKAGLIG